MRAVVTRVTSASVEIGGEVRGRIGKGFLVLLGVSVEDTEAEAKKIADKICGLRVFEDEAGKMNVNPKDAGAGLLIISQFTLYADAKSRRPGFTRAARPRAPILGMKGSGRVKVSLYTPLKRWATSRGW